AFDSIKPFMKEKLKKFRFILLLIPLGIVIRFVDQKVTQDGFLSTNAISDHYLFITGLVVIVIGLLAAILYFDKQSNP
ncbi:MAG: hypothetical protein ACPHVU_05910, partial [Flavobacteriaceae bacterium]